MMNAVALTIAADNSDRIAVAIAATIHDLSDSTGICVGMDTSAASPDHKPLVVCALPVLFDENQLAQKKEKRDIQGFAPLRRGHRTGTVTAAARAFGTATPLPLLRRKNKTTGQKNAGS